MLKATMHHLLMKEPRYIRDSVLKDVFMGGTLDQVAGKPDKIREGRLAPYAEEI